MRGLFFSPPIGWRYGFAACRERSGRMPELVTAPGMGAWTNGKKSEMWSLSRPRTPRKRGVLFCASCRRRVFKRFSASLPGSAPSRGGVPHSLSAKKGAKETLPPDAAAKGGLLRASLAAGPRSWDSCPNRTVFAILGFAPAGLPCSLQCSAASKGG